MFIRAILNACRRVSNSRSPHEVICSVVEEVGELSKEVNAAFGGNCYKSAGVDGVMGEIVDSVSALVDLAYVVEPDLTEARLFDLLLPKMAKWAQSSGFADKPSVFEEAFDYDTLSKAECLVNFGNFKLFNYCGRFYLCSCLEVLV